MVGKSNVFDRDLDLENLDDIQLKNLVYDVAENSYRSVAEKWGIEEEAIHEVFRDADISLRPSSVKKLAKLLEDGIEFGEISRKRLIGAYTDEDKEYIVGCYLKFKSLSKTARYFNANFNRIKEICLETGISEVELQQNSAECLFDLRKIVMFHNVNNYVIFNDVFEAAEYVIDKFASDKTLNSIVTSIRSNCQNLSTKYFDKKWCYIENYEQYIAQNTVHTTESEENQLLCGIYIVKNDANDKVYVGRTRVSFKSRWEKHKRNIHANQLDTCFYQAVRDIGFEHFTFSILEIIDAEEPKNIFASAESKWIKHYHSDLPQYGYNSDSPVNSETTDTLTIQGIAIDILQGYSHNEIATRHDVSLSTVSRVKTGHRTRLENIDYPIISFEEKQVSIIGQILYRLVALTDLSYKEIATIFDVSPTTISEFNKGKTRFAENLDKALFPIREKYNNSELEKLKYEISSRSFRKIAPTNRCSVCNKPISKNAKMCDVCSRKTQQKINISKNELQDLVFKKTFKEIGEMFDVTDRAVAKRCREMGLPYTIKLVKLGKQLGWKEFCESFESNEQEYLSMIKNNYRSTVSKEDVVEMYVKGRMNITDISQKTNKCCDTIRKILREANVQIITQRSCKRIRCIELDIIRDSIIEMAEFLIKNKIAENTTAHHAADYIGQSINHPDKQDGYKGYHFEFVE